MGWTYQTCDRCGGPISFITGAHGPIPIHEGGGGCSARSGGWYNYGSGLSLRRLTDGTDFEFPFITFASFVNPNARCPVCDAPVFFYQSPYGGRVFFDELGPPWPKHP